jgi:hypothetical protein
MKEKIPGIVGIKSLLRNKKMDRKMLVKVMFYQRRNLHWAMLDR